MKRLVGALVCGLALFSGGSANGQGAQPGCPPGSWFCADTGATPTAPPGKPLEPLPPPAAEVPPSPPPAAVAPAPPPYRPSVTVRSERSEIIVTRPDAPPPYPYRPRTALPYRNQWALDLHLGGAMMGSDRAREAGMGGLGVGLRYRPIPQMAMQGDLDFYGGRDYLGYRRSETATSVNTLVFLNPQSRFQVYLVGGLGLSFARVEDDRRTPSPGAVSAVSPIRHYSYLGFQGGAGFEWRIAQHFALHADLRAFVRGRTDVRGPNDYEFVDPATGRRTNGSGGGLLTLGTTIYF